MPSSRLHERLQHHEEGVGPAAEHQEHKGRLWQRVAILVDATELVVSQTAMGGTRVVSEQVCQRALTQKQTLWGGGALQRGHGAPLEPLAQLGDALGSVGAITMFIDTAEHVLVQTVCTQHSQVSMAADSKIRMGSGVLEGDQ